MSRRRHEKGKIRLKRRGRRMGKYENNEEKGRQGGEGEMIQHSEPCLAFRALFYS